MNNDNLRLNSKDADDGIAVEEFNAEKPKKANDDDLQKGLTIFSLFKPDEARILGWDKGKTRSLVSIFTITLLFAVVLFAIAAIACSIVALISACFVTAVVLPLCLIVFFYELNNMSNVGVFELVIGTLVGVSYNILISLIRRSLETVFPSGYSEVVCSALYTAVTDVLLFGVAYLCAFIFKKDCAFGTILIVVTVIGGFSVSDTVTSLIKGLFIELPAYDVGQALVSAPKYFYRSFNDFVPILINEGLIMTVLMGIWSVVCGTIISAMLAPVKVKAYGNVYIFGTLILIVAMHVGVELKYVYSPLTVLIYFFVILFSFILSIKFLNDAVSVTNFSAGKIDAEREQTDE